eukprot:TRINITY_DN50790_c0_g1_i1.p1 TRINITY_DN50790_c0_g1~~TRINITY_DN50790_c0_g1_i1.p1  ORF type:complete len:362 (+),score=117.77 TRINITY_DN50790_c0_g1_i1:98-1183(+)
MARNLAAAVTPTDSFAAAAAAGAGQGANPFAGRPPDVEAEEDEDFEVTDEVPRDAFGEFISGEGEADADYEAELPDLTEEEDQWIREQIAQDEAMRGPHMQHLHPTVSEGEIEDEMEHWMNAIMPDSGSVPLTPRASASGGSPPESQKRVIDLADPDGGSYTKSEFEMFYGGTREWDRACYATQSGILWEVVRADGVLLREEPSFAAPAVGAPLPCGQRGVLLRVQCGFACDAESRHWIPLRDPETEEQLAVLREQQPRRVAPDGRCYTQQEFVAHFGGKSQWAHALPECGAAAPASPPAPADAAAAAGPPAGAAGAAQQQQQGEGGRQAQLQKLEMLRQELAQLERRKRELAAAPRAAPS